MEGPLIKGKQSAHEHHPGSIPTIIVRVVVVSVAETFLVSCRTLSEQLSRSYIQVAAHGGELHFSLLP